MPDLHVSVLRQAFDGLTRLSVLGMLGNPSSCVIFRSGIFVNVQRCECAATAPYGAPRFCEPSCDSKSPVALTDGQSLGVRVSARARVCVCMFIFREGFSQPQAARDFQPIRLRTNKLSCG